MQVSRTVRCLQGNQALRTLQLFRSFDEASRSTAQRCYFQHHHQPQQVAPVVHCFKSRYSTGKGSEKQTLQAATPVEQDEINISDILEEVSTPHPHALMYKNLTRCYRKLSEVSADGTTTTNETDLWDSDIKHQMHTIVKLSLTESAPPDMRKKCLAVLLHYDPSNAFVSKILEQTVKDSRFLAIRTIAEIIHLLSVSGQQISISKDARKDLVLATTHKRWYEISSQYILLFLYQLDELFDMKEICLINKQHSDSPNSDRTPSTIEMSSMNMEKRLVQLVDENEMKSKDLARVVALMGKWRNRKQILLHALTHRLSLVTMTDFSLFHLSNLLFACSALSIHNAPLFDKLCTELASRELSTPVAMSVLSSMSHLRWHNAALVSKCVTRVSDSINRPETGGKRELTSQDCHNVLKSLANFYSIPTSAEEREVIKSLARLSLMGAKSSLQKVDIAWCLAILKQLDGATADVVLDPSVVQELNDKEDFQAKIALQKLRGVSLAAKFELEGYEGPYMDDQLMMADSGKESSASQNSLTTPLMNALRKFTNVESYVKVSQSLLGGLHADAVLCVDPKGTPKPLSSLDNSDGQNHRVAIQVVPFTEALKSLQEEAAPSGVHQMSMRHLRHMGYTPVQIPYSDLRKTQSVLEHINSIQSRLKKAVCDNDNNTSTTPSQSSSSSLSSSSSSSQV